MRGRDFLEEYVAQKREEQLAQMVDFKCDLCDWAESGPLGSYPHVAHRKEAHPEVKTPPKRAHRVPMLVSPTLKSLDENIAAVREQGGHRWDEAA